MKQGPNFIKQYLYIFNYCVLQVQSSAQYKYLYEAVADYAKRVEKGEKPTDNEEDTLLNEGQDDYLMEDDYALDV